MQRQQPFTTISRALALVGLPALTLAACSGGDETIPPGGESEPPAEVVTASEAINSSNIPTIDPAALTDAEISRVVSGGATCSFAYTAASKPVLAVSEGDGVMKLNGRLVALSSEPDPAGLASGGRFTADGMRLTVEVTDPGPGVGDRADARMIFDLDQGLHVGYRGWYTCSR